MFIKDWKREVFTIPNFLSFIRLLLIPVYTIIYLNAKQFQDFSLAAGILAISCLTDMIDGKIARQFDMISNIGKILDPLVVSKHSSEESQFDYDKPIKYLE